MISTAEHKALPLQLNEWKNYLTVTASRLGEMCWFALALLLFIIMGPFAVPVVLWVVFTSACEDQLEPPSITNGRFNL